MPHIMPHGPLARDFPHRFTCQNVRKLRRKLAVVQRFAEKPAKPCLPSVIQMARVGRIGNHGNIVHHGNTTQTGLTVQAHRVTQVYPTGVKVSDAEMNRLQIEAHAVCPQWNYTIRPRPLN